MNTAVALDLLLALLTRADAIGSLLRNAHSEGRDISEAELDKLAAEDDAAKATLDAAIKKARG